MEKAIDTYTNYIYIVFAFVTILFIGAAITFVILLIKKSKKDRIKDEIFIEKKKNINSIKCPSCLKEIDGDSTFCKYCGRSINKEN